MKKINLKSIVCTLFCVILTCLLFVSCGKKTIKVAFCNVSESVQTVIKETVLEECPGKYDFKEIPPVTEKTAKKIAKKYDLFFGENGKVVSVLSDYAQEFPADLKYSFPDSIISNETKALPVLLNHYGFAYSTVVKNNAKARYPGNLQQFEKYLQVISNKTNFPLFVAGEDDYTFLTFLSCFIESSEGTAGYKAFISALENYTDLQTFLKTPVSDTETMESVLNLLNDWQEKGYLIKNWIYGKQIDFKNLSEDNLVGIGFLSLDQFHSLSNSVAGNYVCDRFPVKKTSVSHSIICPAVVCLNLSQNPVASEIQTKLIEPEVQKNLSKGSTLAPVETSAQAFDKQAADVRFLAAACKDGPVPSAATKVFETDAEKLHLVCEELRSFLR